MTKIFRISVASGIPYRQAVGLLGLLALTLMVAAPVQAAPSSTIRFGAPAWPGVTVKTEVAAQLIQAMGYKTKTMHSSPAFIISALKSDNLDAYLGGWMPTEKDMIDPAADKGDVKILAKNITGPILGLAVPDYVWQAGVHTEADLAKHADKFDHKIYGIETGSGFNKDVQRAIKDNRHGLGDWKLVQTSTSAMLTQVKRAIDKNKWIVFLGWKPHWMNISYHIKYLKAVGDSKIAETKSQVLSVVNPKLVKRQPEVAKFLKQFVVSSHAQSQWIYEYSKQHHKAHDIAAQWISKHPDQIKKWLKDVKTRKGDSAFKAAEAKFKSG